MDESSLFMQWAMDTLQHEHQLQHPSLQQLGGSAALKNGGMASSGNTSAVPVATENDSVGSSSVSWNFASAFSRQPGNEATTVPSSRARDVPAADPAASRRASAAAASTGHTSPAARDHIMAERKRREKINRRFIELSTVIPGLKKMDKATILSDAVRYIKEQQEKLRALEDSTATTRSVLVLVKKPCIESPFAAAPTPTTTRSALPEIEVAISESNVMVRIHCEDAKGVLVRLLAQVEGLHLSITHTNVIPFPACTVIITIVAKVDEGFKITTEDIAGKLQSALRLKNLEAAKT
ncbi:transcription factor bHLH25 [Brachypodium distachyon]|uniref:BHLH domain-containing protein n=1 Tax=Brachypodium distachyon TaxID=15368 RepID=A0A0Q3GSL6_BRADI|nr:transcription factor bHLH25 [Brachypodium distachyon]KQK13832.1 hypothetical protein BRADI_1g12760v3 [Brachypodium distachyon]|eukprot:XP_010229513.2 transcription factor bHLH25 [Brachypodium distachyon]